MRLYRLVTQAPTGPLEVICDAKDLRMRVAPAELDGLECFLQYARVGDVLFCASGADPARVEAIGRRAVAKDLPSYKKMARDVRLRTGASMRDAMVALIESEGDLQGAVNFLRLLGGP